ncbi:MAG: hypothetical protein CVV64_18440 [Candidatus Wallbacteria bacterium HGW-Wallbacteria-1]|jgi:hypothetical protein|uniref:Uncharacterized protein n=1 Tax=Candidatus Wallbacteria bacterium HGW-Wallbacteria-1 TaxID=2013854 RepID=A0A2N1PJL7_9BACT|nr:MAG: hypothetical protein CVV64_18440 [Candidatus Wallbacteria bacterium HGW-Wallbacteria-1]
MNFVITFRGIIKSNGDAAHKHSIRCDLQKQIRKLWQREISNHGDKSVRDFICQETSVKKNNGEYIPLMGRFFGVSCKLEILLLKPKEVNIFQSDSRDLDNQLKTLLDALAVPPDSQAMNLPPNEANPFYVLLEDDKIVKDIRIRVAELLEDCTDQDELLAVIEVTAKRHEDIMDEIHQREKV